MIVKNMGLNLSLINSVPDNKIRIIGRNINWDVMKRTADKDFDYWDRIEVKRKERKFK